MIRRLGVRLLILVGIAYLSLFVALFFYQRAILFPGADPSRVARALTVSGMREVFIASHDGLSLRAGYLPAKKGKPTLVYFHGNSGDIVSPLPRVKRLAALGYGVFIPEYRGFGGNPGRPTQHDMVLDAQTALTYVQTYVPRDEIIYYGVSLGTGVAVQLAALHPPKALILEAPYTSIADAAAARFRYLPVLEFLLFDPFNSMDEIDKIHCPKLFLHGEQDRVIPFSLGTQLYEAAPEPKQAWFHPEAGHNNLYQHGAFNAIQAFLKSLGD